jgi:gliding motility-associated-like protein
VTPERNGCFGTPTTIANIAINPPVVNKIDNYPSFACPELPVGPFVVENSTGGNFLTYNYTWQYSNDSSGVYVPISNSNSPRFNAPMQDSLRWYRVVTESGGCKNITPSVKVIARSRPEVKINLNTNSAIIGIGNSVQVFSTGAQSYEWTPKYEISNAYISNPILSPLTTTKYTVIGTDNFGCINKDTLTVQVTANYSIEPNKIITPNGDYINDTWEIKNIKFYPDNKITLYDNQGSVIKLFEKYTGGWDATVNNQKLPIGNYYYIINLDNGKTSITGFLTIIY